MTFRGIIFVSVAAAVVVGSVFVAPSAYAQESWLTQISCGPNNRCAISSNSTGKTTYTVGGIQRASFPTGGPHSWSGAVSSGGHSVSIWTEGALSAHNAYCYCPSGTICPLAIEGS